MVLMCNIHARLVLSFFDKIIKHRFGPSQGSPFCSGPWARASHAC